MRVTLTDEQIAEKLIEKLDCSLIEASDIIQTDKKIDDGADPYPLSNEQEQAAKKARSTTSKKSRATKVNSDKRYIMQTIIDNLKDCKVNVKNPEREIEFYYKEVRYKLVLSVPRK